ncbi:MAG: GvpL/GvpF family gas vesicle protein, partial [Candidatus Electryoneaceae bacterium]|nr:GvpL/GvpF family gas vesicle protein [Candidatus Electryoneaceae bacterium]
MTPISSPTVSRYIYAIVAESEDREYGTIGIDGSAVYVIRNGSIAAVVSDINIKRIRPERRHLAAHNAVLNTVMMDTTPLPMSFGIIADNSIAVQRILEDNQEEFAMQLQRMYGKVEFGLRVLWDVPQIFEYFVQTHPELQVMRDQMIGGNSGMTQGDKIELGQMFAQVIDDDRETFTASVEEILRDYCYEIKRNKPR